MSLTKKTAPFVLLAEDSDDDAYFFERAFKKSGVNCGIFHARNGKIAVETLDGIAVSAGDIPFLIFLDLKMPEMTGFDVLEWLKASRLAPKPKVLVLSGSNDAADKARALALGASDYLVKPITAEDLRARLTHELRSGGHQPSSGETV